MAKAEFIAGSQTGTASVSAYFAYHFANGHQGFCMGSAPLAIGLPPVSVWKVRGEYSATYQRIIDVSYQGIAGFSLTYQDYR